jgi:hypothetical protein
VITIGDETPVAVMSPGELVTVYKVIGNFEKLGGLNEILAVVGVSAVADVISATVGTPLTLADAEDLIGIVVSYLTLALLIFDLAHT